MSKNGGTGGDEVTGPRSSRSREELEREIERCPVCQEATHASESDDAGRCAPCAAAEAKRDRQAAAMAERWTQD